MALEQGSRDESAEVPPFETYVVASRLDIAVPYEDLTTAMVEVEARERRGDDGMMVMGYTANDVPQRLYRQRDGYTPIGEQISRQELEAQRVERETSSFCVRQQGFSDAQDRSGDTAYMAELAGKNPGLTSKEAVSEYRQGFVQQQYEARSTDNVQLEQQWFERHSFNIRESNTVAAYPPEQMAVAQAYWTGQRDLYNSVREDAIALNPAREKDLPAAIEMHEIQVRQQIQEPEQAMEMSR